MFRIAEHHLKIKTANINAQKYVVRHNSELYKHTKNTKFLNRASFENLHLRNIPATVVLSCSCVYSLRRTYKCPQVQTQYTLAIH